MLFVTLIFCLVVGNFAQTPGIGFCPEFDTVSPFDSNKYLGLWYENRRSVPNFFEIGSKCVTANYSANNDSTIKVINRKISSLTGHESKIVGTAFLDTSQCQNFTRCAKLVVEFPIPILGNVRGSYWILDTDYTSYSIVWSCTNIVFYTHVKYLWLLTREQNPSKSVLDKINNVINQLDIPFIPTLATHQRNCL